MTNPLTQDIRLGTMVNGGPNTVSYIQQILPHGFESFAISFWQTLGGTDLKRLAEDVKAALDGTGVVISVLNIFGNPLETEPKDCETLIAWEQLIDNAHLFGADIVAGFTGRLRGKPLPESLPRYKEVFTPLAKRAADRGVRIAFENCPMGGDWQRGDWNIAHNPQAWELMFNAIPADNIGLEWEPCHQMVQLIDPLPQIRKWGKKMFHLHGKDATIRWDVVREHGIGGGPVEFAYHRTPGFGDTNWKDVFSELRLIGFQGAIDIEGWHDPVYRGTLEMTGQVYGLNYLKQCRGGAYVENPK